MIEDLMDVMKANGVDVVSITETIIFNVPCYVVDTETDWNALYLSDHLKINKDKFEFLGTRGYGFALREGYAKEILKNCDNFNFKETLKKKDYHDIIKRRLIICGNGDEKTIVRVKGDALILLYNVDWSAKNVADNLNIPKDSVVDVSADWCADLDKIIILDRVIK